MDYEDKKSREPTGENFYTSYNAFFLGKSALAVIFSVFKSSDKCMKDESICKNVVGPSGSNS